MLEVLARMLVADGVAGDNVAGDNVASCCISGTSFCLPVSVMIFFLSVRPQRDYGVLCGPCLSGCWEVCFWNCLWFISK